MEDASSFFLTYVSLAVGSCIWVLLMLFNMYSLFKQMRSSTDDEPASGLAKAAWAVGFLSFLLGPCSWLGAVIAIAMARVETGRMYNEESSLAGSTPCRMASLNAGATLLMWVVITAGVVAGLIM